MQSSQDGGDMFSRITAVGRSRAVAMFADWTDRIAGGELPPIPPRPQGQERNVVITEWDWADPKAYLHDEIATDKRNPTLNANGPVFGAHEHSSDFMTVLDPSKASWSQLAVPVRDPNTPFSLPQQPLQPSPYWGTKPSGTARRTCTTAMFDAQGPALARRLGPSGTDSCVLSAGLKPSIGEVVSDESEHETDLAFYDPKTKQFTTINTCAGSLHLNLAEDANNTLWFSGPGADVVGWLNTKMFDETHDEQKSQGWTPLILDTNGNGKRDAYVEPKEPIDPARDKRIGAFLYGLVPSPVDGSIWGTVVNGVPGWAPFPGAIVRLSPGPNPPVTALAEIYEPPFNNPKAPVQGYSPRGLDVDRNGVVWTVLASGHLASFDRRKCKGPLNGPTATGQHCPEGLDAVSHAGPSIHGCHRVGQRRFELLRLGRSVRHLRVSGRTSRSRPATDLIRSSP